jgi:hypothetical protein
MSEARVTRWVGGLLVIGVAGWALFVSLDAEIRGEEAAAWRAAAEARHTADSNARVAYFEAKAAERARQATSQAADSTRGLWNTVITPRRPAGPCRLRDGTAAPGYELLWLNLWEDSRLYRGTPCRHVADVVAIQGDDVTIRTAADGDLVTFPRAFVQSKFVTDDH